MFLGRNLSRVLDRLDQTQPNWRSEKSEDPTSRQRVMRQVTLDDDVYYVETAGSNIEDEDNVSFVLVGDETPPE